MMPAEGARVQIMDPFNLDPKAPWLEAAVETLMSTQFTARTYDTARVMYVFYRDEFVTWRNG